MSSNNVPNRRVEVMAGLTSFFAISYIVIVNPLILADGGIPAELSVFATIFASAIGCLLMAFWADVPIILTPGMGINAFFTYTVVTNMGFRWQEALAISLVSALIFFALAVTRAGRVLADAVPKSLKYAVTAGIGLFLVEIGLEKAELIRAGENSILALGDLRNPSALLALLGLVLSLLFYQRRVKGGFFIAILIVTVIANALGLVQANTIEIDMTRLGEYGALLFAEDFSSMLTVSFWLAVFSMTMILVCESIGLLEGLLPDTAKFRNAFRASSLTAVLSSVLGTSPTVAAAESAAGIVEGGRSGLTALVGGALFLLTLVFIPLLAYVPQAAVAPVIIITGALMMQHLENIQFQDFSEWFPAFLIIVLIPLTNSISTGLAFGFAAHPMMKVFTGRRHELGTLSYVLGVLFLLQLVFEAAQ